jgi:PAS domain S-box-containing protein
MQQLVNTTVPFGKHLPKSALPEAVETAMATGRPQVTGLFRAPVAKQLLYAITVPVKIDGESRYVLGRSPDQHALSSLVAPNRLRTGWQAVVSDATRRIITRSDRPDAFVGRELSPSQWHRAGPEGVFEFSDTEGRSSLEAYTRSELTGWEAAVWAPQALLEAPIRALWRTLVLTALLAIALVVALASWLGRIIARAVAHAARAATDSGEDDPPWPSGTPVAEVNTLMAELRETSQLLRGSEHQLRLVTDNAAVGILHLDAELRYKFLNKYHAEQLKARLGLAPEQVIGKRLPEVVGDRLFATFEPYARECLAGKAVEFQVEMPYRADQPEFLQYRLEPDWKDGKVVGLVSAGTDITRLKLAEAALGESEAAFRAMFDVSSVGKVEVEPGTGRFLRANAAMCKFVGYTEGELLARTVYDVTHPDDRDLDRKLLPRMVAGELAGFELEKRYIRKDGKPVWARTAVNVIRDGFGRPLRNIGVILDIGERKRAEEDLKASKDRLQLALDAARLGSWQYDPLRRASSGDARANEIFDFDIAEKEVVIEEILRRVHPDDVERVRAAAATALDPVDPKPFAIEYRVWRGDGKVRWVENHGLAYFEGAGPERQVVSFVGTAQDITERKEREEREHLLMRQINHRAKNMLSVVDSIAHQTATRNPEDFVKRFSERIQALSANQDLLVRNEWRGVGAEDLVRAQLAPFAELIGSRIVLDGPKLRLNAASAQAIGLAVHELATNAGKYGAISTDRGRVDICWGTDGDTFTMGWTEHEGPPVSLPKRRGFGTIVMKTMAERSVDGTVDLDFAPSGVMWRLTCPAANALSAGNGKASQPLAVNSECLLVTSAHEH